MFHVILQFRNAIALVKSRWRDSALECIDDASSDTCIGGCACTRASLDAYDRVSDGRESTRVFTHRIDPRSFYTTGLNPGTIER